MQLFIPSSKWADFALGLSKAEEKFMGVTAGLNITIGLGVRVTVVSACSKDKRGLSEADFCFGEY